jgi:hypothetical protein
MVKIVTESKNTCKYAIGNKVVVTENINEHQKGDIRTIIGIGSPSGHFDYTLDDGYIHECNIRLLKSKPTKTRRIEALESEVARLRLLEKEVIELKSIISELRKKESVETPKVNNTETEIVISFENKQYRKVEREVREGDVVIFRVNDTHEHHSTVNKPYKVVVSETIRFRGDSGNMYNVFSADHDRAPETTDVYELIESKPLASNRQRVQIIEEAKNFIEDMKNITGSVTGRKGYKYVNHKYICDAEFTVDTESLSVTCKMKNQIESEIMAQATYECQQEVFNEHIGKAIALGRALGLIVSKFENAPQPNRRTEGMVMEWRGKKRTITDSFILGETCSFDSEFAIYGTMVDDTNAEY